jgi:hypothetical protein
MTDKTPFILAGNLISQWMITNKIGQLHYPEDLQQRICEAIEAAEQRGQSNAIAIIEQMIIDTNLAIEKYHDDGKHQLGDNLFYSRRRVFEEMIEKIKAGK